MVDVEIQDRARALVAAGAFEFDLDHLAEELPVGQAGQPVVQGHVLDAPLRLDALGDVLRDAFDRDDATAAVADRDRLFENLANRGVWSIDAVSQLVGGTFEEQRLALRPVSIRIGNHWPRGCRRRRSQTV